MATLNCPYCHQAIDIVELLSDMGGYDTPTDSGAARCRHCDGPIEFRVRSNAIEVGYTYFGGSMHFESIETYPMPGLQRHRLGSNVSIEYRGAVYPPPA